MNLASSLGKHLNKDGMKTTKMTDFFPRRTSNAGSSNPPSSQPAAPPSSQPDSTPRAKSSSKIKAAPKAQSTVTTRSTSDDASDHAQGGPSGHNSKAKGQGNTPSFRLPLADADAVSVASTALSEGSSTTSSRARSRIVLDCVEIKTRGPPKQRLGGKGLSTPPSTSGDMPVSRRRLSLVQPQVTSRRSSKRKYGQDEPAPSPIHQPTKRRTRAKGKSKQGSLPLKHRTNTVPANCSPRKKPRLSTPNDLGDDAASSFVPSSRSDEEELVLPRPSGDEPEKNIDMWRGGVQATPQRNGVDDNVFGVPNEDYDMTASEDGHLSMHVSSSLTPASSRPSTPEYYLPSPVSPVPPASLPPSSSPAHPSAIQPTPRKHRLRTPPPTSPPSPPTVTPVALDRKTKTQRFIEEIKQNMAQEMAQYDDDSDKERVDLSFSDLDDSSDEEDWRPFASEKKAASSSNASSSNKSREQANDQPALTTPSPDPQHESPSLSSPDRSWAVRPSRTRKAPERKPAPLTVPKKELKKSKPFDPIGDLLKGKRRDEKQGKGIEAQRRAEGHDRDELLSEIRWDENGDLADEDAAIQAARKGLKMRLGSETQSTDDDDDGEGGEEVSEEMRIKLLGKDNGEAVGKIFDTDRANKDDEETVRGVQIWKTFDASEEVMDLDDVLPEWENDILDEEHPILRKLRDAALRNDLVVVKLVLVFQQLDSVSLAKMPSAVRWLCDLALSTRSDDLPGFAVSVLRQLPDKLHKPTTSPLPPDFVRKVFVRLGMQPEVLKHFTSMPSGPAVPRNVLERVLSSMTAIMMSFAKAGWLNDYYQECMPGEIAFLPILVGMDIDASPDLRARAMEALECLFCSLPADVNENYLEESVARRIFAYARALSDTNQAHLMTMFQIHSPQSRRVARFLAYSLITGVLPDEYMELPPLKLLLDHLPFKITNLTDYNELGARVEVVSFALTDIPKYIVQEGVIRRSGALERARSTSPKGIADHVYDRLMTMHGRISDTRAAHLDRSRAKDVIQRLAHRVHYDKIAAHGQRGRQSKLTDTIQRLERD